MNNNHNNNNKASFVLIMIMIMNSTSINMATLRVGFYKESCPSAESIIQQIVHQTFLTKKSVTPALLRMHYHDCFVRGCDASILLDSTRKNQAEKAAAANSGIQEYQLIDIIKSRLEQICPKTVSCADIIALATRDAVALASGPNYDVPTGRRDGLISRSNEVNLPGPTSTISEARKAFEAHGLTLNDMVVLLGAHTVGTTHCSFIKDRLLNFKKSGAPDPTMERGLVKKLKKTCGSKNNVDRSVFLDQNTSFIVDNMYYKEIVKRQGVLKIDQVIAQDKQTSKLVAILATNNFLFGEQFAKALVKLGTLQVMEGNNGEIRRNCRMVNN